MGAKPPCQPGSRHCFCILWSCCVSGDGTDVHFLWLGSLAACHFFVGPVHQDVASLFPLRCRSGRRASDSGRPPTASNSHSAYCFFLSALACDSTPGRNSSACTPFHDASICTRGRGICCLGLTIDSSTRIFSARLSPYRRDRSVARWRQCTLSHFCLYQPH